MKTKWIRIVFAGLTLAVLGLLGCATPREAATVGAWMGRQIGTPMGIAATAVEESFHHAGDIRYANPRFDGRPRTTQRLQSANDDSTHVYRANVVVKTEGPARVRSIEVSDPEDVTAFWTN
jgi:hypothetical protein